jgi:hypothetical protein
MGAAVIRSRKKDAILRTPLIKTSMLDCLPDWAERAYSLLGELGCPVYDQDLEEVSHDAD